MGDAAGCRRSRGGAGARADFFLQWWSAEREPTLPGYLGVRGERFKYVAYPEAGVEELYDLAADPFELTNRAADPAASAALATMRARLAQYLAAP